METFQLRPEKSFVINVTTNKLPSLRFAKFKTLYTLSALMLFAIFLKNWNHTETEKSQIFIITLTTATIDRQIQNMCVNTLTT